MMKAFVGLVFAAMMLAGCGGYMHLGTGKLARNDAIAFVQSDNSCDLGGRAVEIGSGCYVSPRDPARE